MKTSIKVARTLFEVGLAGIVTWAVIDYVKEKEKEIVRAEIKKQLIKSITPDL